ncbi:hypothetical protein BH09PSE2_BH09PSE2_02120 [soil metagenome]
MAAWFSHDYALPQRAPLADARRAAGYASWIGSLGGGRPSAVLDAGCGSGALLAALGDRWPGARLTGFDPAIPRDAVSPGGARMLRGGEERVAGETFDLVVSVNAIEHTSDPRRFLAALADALAEDGTLVLVCPDGESVGTELLIADHLHSFSRRALVALGRAVGLKALAHERRDGFQMVVLHRGAAAVSDAAPLDAAGLAAGREALLCRWLNLDEALAARLPPRLPTFGAGEAAALLRAYAPAAWARTEQLMLDDPGDAWPLDRPVVGYRPAESVGDPILLAVSATGEPGLAHRLRADGWNPIGTADLLRAEVAA